MNYWIYSRKGTSFERARQLLNEDGSTSHRLLSKAQCSGCPAQILVGSAPAPCLRNVLLGKRAPTHDARDEAAKVTQAFSAASRRKCSSRVLVRPSAIPYPIRSLFPFPRKEVARLAHAGPAARAAHAPRMREKRPSGRPVPRPPAALRGASEAPSITARIAPGRERGTGRRMGCGIALGCISTPRGPAHRLTARPGDHIWILAA